MKSEKKKVLSPPGKITLNALKRIKVVTLYVNDMFKIIVLAPNFMNLSYVAKLLNAGSKELSAWPKL